MKTVFLFDPSIRESPATPNRNLGDLIIHDAIAAEFGFLLGQCRVDRYSTQIPLPWSGVWKSRQADLALICGTNLLSSTLDQHTPWKLSIWKSRFVQPACLIGVGWWSDQELATPEAKAFYHRVLSKKWVHSVRDEMTAERLRKMGFSNVENTSCPTLWGLHAKTAADFPKPQQRTVLTMISVWRKKPELDKKLLELLLQEYERVVFWPQGHKDKDYLNALAPGMESLEYSMESLETFLRENPEADYLGLRLHGGIRCLQRGLRSLIVEVDNRAREIAHDTGLPTVQRDNFDFMTQWIRSGKDFKITTNQTAIERVKQQFRPLMEKSSA